MSFVGGILDPVAPEQPKPSSPSAPTSLPAPPTTTEAPPPPPATTNNPPPPHPPPVETSAIPTSILTTISNPEPPAPTTPLQPAPPPPSATSQGSSGGKQPAPSRGSGGGSQPSFGAGHNGGGQPISTPTLGPSINGTANAQNDTNNSGSSSTATVIGSLVGVVAAVCLILAGLLIWRKRQQKKQSFEALFGSDSLAAASGLNNNDDTGSSKPIYAHDVEEGIRENKPMPSPPPLTSLEPAYGADEQTYYNHTSAMSPQAASAQVGYDQYDAYYQQGGEAYNMQDYNAYQGGVPTGEYDHHGYYQQDYGEYPVTSGAVGTAGSVVGGASGRPDDLDSMAYYPYNDQSAAGAQHHPSYNNRRA